MRRVLDFLTVTAFAAALLTPWIGRALGGRGGEHLEMRPLTKRPNLTVEALLDPNVGTGWSDWFRDHVPLRGPMLRTDHHLDYWWLDDSPTPKVTLGKDDWLWLTESLYPWPFRKQPALSEEIAIIEQLLAAVRASGRKVLFAMSPNKASLYPEWLRPRDREAARAAQRRRDALRQHFRDEPGFLDLWRPMNALRDRLAQQPIVDENERRLNLLFRPRDRHAGEDYARLQARSITARLWPEFDGEGLDVPAEVEVRQSELGRRFLKIDLPEPYRVRPAFKARERRQLVGRPSTLPTTNRQVFHALDYGVRTRPIVKANVVVVRDSFMTGSRPYLAYDVQRVTFVNWMSMRTGHARVVHRTLRQADAVVFQLVEDDSGQWLPDALQVVEGLPKRRKRR